MLSDAEFQAWCDRLQLSQQQRNLVNQIRTSPPARKVKGNSRNVAIFVIRRSGYSISKKFNLL